MSNIKEIRPAYPVTHVKQRDPEDRKHDRRPEQTGKKKQSDAKNDGVDPHIIDEYV